MSSTGIRISLGLVASVAPLALMSPVSASPWTSIAQNPGPAVTSSAAVNPFARETNLAQAPAKTQVSAKTETSDAERVLIERARYWRGRNRPELAAQALDRLLAADPSSLHGLYEKGMLAASLGNGGEAQQYLARLRSAHPNASTQIAQLERAAQQGQVSRTDVDQARRLAQTGSFDQAARRYQQAFRGTPPPEQYSLEYYQTLAGTTAGFEEGRRGLQDLAKSGDPQARLALARTLTYREGTRRDGVRQLQELTRVPAVSAEATSAWRQALLWLGRGPQDKALYEAYLAAHPSDGEIRSRREGAVAQAPTVRSAAPARSAGPDPRARLRAEAFGELNAGDLNDAEAGFQQALRARPSDPDALAGLGIVRLRQDRFAEARDLLGRASRDAAARRKYGEAYEAAYFWAGMDDAEAAYDSGRYDQAEATLNNLLRRNYRDGHHARRLLGDIYAKQGREDLAERQYHAALQAAPDDAAAMTGLFNVYTAQNRTQDALNVAARLESSSAATSTSVQSGTLRLRAKQYELSGEDDAAFAAYQDGIVVDPTDPWLRLDFARFLARRGEQGQANAMI